MRTICQKTLKEVLHYEPSTGVFTWKVDRGNGAKIGSVAGHFHKRDGCVRLVIFGEEYYADKLAFLYMKCIVPRHVKHLNGDKGDNRWENLQACKARYVHNIKEPRSGFRGVYKDHSGYAVTITREGETAYVGYYHTLEEAKKARLAAEAAYEELA